METLKVFSPYPVKNCELNLVGASELGPCWRRRTGFSPIGPLGYLKANG